MKTLIYFLIPGLFLFACNSNDKADAYGNFEATEISVSSEATGKLIMFTVEEGQTVEKGSLVGLIDTVQLHLKKEQLKASRSAVASRTRNIVAQIGVLKEQRANAIREFERLQNMAKGGAATPKQIDDMDGSIDVLNSQITSVESQNAPILGELKALDAQIAQIDDQINKSKIFTPVSGIILSKLMEPQEFVTTGKTLFKIADLNALFLRAYVSGSQLGQIKIGQKVNVFIDNADETLKQMPGTISWVSSKAEFTPKIIQTKEERVNLVYAVKIKVDNDGSLKIGMPAEVKFH